MGTEFRVNSYQNNWQRDPHALGLRDGGFVVTWSSYFNNYDDTDIRSNYVAAQFYDANGLPLGSELVLRGLTEGFSGTPKAAQLKNGNIVVTWAESGEDPIMSGDTYIAAQVFTTSGQAVSEAFRVDTVRSNEAVYPDVVATGKGGFIVSYGAETGGKRFDEVYSRSFDADGNAVGKDKALNPKSFEFDELVTKGAELSNGHSVVIWNSEAALDDKTYDGQNQIRASLFNENGKVIKKDFGLTEHFGGAGGAWSDSENYGYAVAAAKGGGFAVANLNWTKNKNDDGAMAINFSAYNAQGRQTIDAFEIFKKGEVVGDLDMARLKNGQYVVAWDQHSLKQSDIGNDTYAMILSAKGKPIGKVFTVGEDASKYDDQTDVSVAALKNGGFVITYMSEAIDADHDGVAATYYAPGEKPGRFQKVEAADVFDFADAGVAPVAVDDGFMM